MAKPPMPSQLSPVQAIPAPYPQPESAYPGSARYGFLPPGEIRPSGNGNLGFMGLKPCVPFVENPEPGYRPMSIYLRKGGM